MTLPFDPTTAIAIAQDRAVRLRRDWLQPLHTSHAWRTGEYAQTARENATPTVKPDCRPTGTPASAS